MTVNNEGSPNSVEFYRDQYNRIVPAVGKIADITHADTNEHSMSLPAVYPANTRAIYIRCARIAGTGEFQVHSVSGDAGITQVTGRDVWWIRAADGLFYYALSVANDDWDIYADGYITGGP